MLAKSICLLLALVCFAATGAAQSTQPATQPDTQTLTLRAAEAFNRGDYAAALPLFQRLAEHYRNQPVRLAGVEEQIRFCQRNMIVAPPPTTQPISNRDPTTGRPRVAHELPKPGEVREVTIKELGNFEYGRKGGNVPEDVKRLDGLQVRTRGFMMPLDQADNVTVFLLMPSLTNCCLGQAPTLQHMILVHAPAGKAVGFTPDEVIIEGRLSVQEKIEEDVPVSLFELQCTSARVAAGGS